MIQLLDQKNNRLYTYAEIKENNMFLEVMFASEFQDKNLMVLTEPDEIMLDEKE